MKKHTGLDFADMMVEQYGEKALEVALETVRQVHVRRLRQTATYRSRVREVTETFDQQRIVEAVCNHFGITRKELCLKHRSPSLCQARRVCWALLRDRLKLSLVEIGALFERDHTTVMAALNKDGARGDEYAVIASELDGLRKVS